MDKNHGDIRKKLWCDMAIGTASAANCTRVSSAINWADHILKEFDLRFKEDVE